MELAGRVYDIVTRPENLFHDRIRDLVPKSADFQHTYWRRVLRMAALCHDVGHLPFSHAAEHELLPAGTNHETLSWRLIVEGELAKTFHDIKIQPIDVAKLAVGRRKSPAGVQFTEWEEILSEIIVGNAFGVDRIDYLLRDAYHTGVAYGRFDHFRLLDTLRILPREDIGSKEAALGIMVGGIHTAEALLLARYFMYSQLYFHPVRRIYDLHLRDFLKAWLPTGMFSTDLEAHLSVTDNEVTAAMLAATKHANAAGHIHARHIAEHHHFHLLYSRNPRDFKSNPAAAEAIYAAVTGKFGAEWFRIDRYSERNNPSIFPVYSGDGRVISSLEESEVIGQVPALKTEFIFVHPEKYEATKDWLEANRDSIITKQPKLL